MPIRVFILLFFLTLTAASCDSVYKKLHKEGAQEQELVGKVELMELNERVAEIQKLLRFYGYNPGSVDGMMGANTRLAVKKFQADNHLPETGFVDNQTWESLNQFRDSGLVTNGELNIATVQYALKKAGFDSGAVDGKMGPRTQRMIVEFQKSAGLNPDGKIGFKTLSQLAGVLRKK